MREEKGTKERKDNCRVNGGPKSTPPQGSGSSVRQDKGVLTELTPHCPWTGVGLWGSHRTPH